MSNPLGDFDASTVVYGKFNTFRPSTGAPFTLGGTPALSVYKDNSTTESTSGVTLTVDFDSRTGLHHFAIDTSADGTFYSAGSFFDVVITTGSVDSVSLVGTTVASFTIRKNSSLKPATAGRTLVVDANGLADANTVKVGPSGSGTAQTAGDIIGDTNDIQSRLPAALVSGRIDASVGAMAANTLTAAATAADFGAEIADAVWDEDLSGHQTIGTAGRSLTLSGTILSETTAAGTPTTTTLELTAGSATNDFYNDLEVIPTSGTLAGQARVITDYDGATKTITVDEPWTSAPAAGITVLIRATHKHSINQIQSGLATSAAVAALPTANQNADALLDRSNGIETGWTLRQIMRVMSSVLLGKTSGGGTTSETFRDINDTKNRVVSGNDGTNRTGSTYDAT